MGRRKALSDNACLTSFLLAIHHHPWATPELIQAYSGLSPQAIKRVAQPLALAHGLVERGDLPSTARAERRFGLTPAGAALLGQRLSLAMSRDAYLRARTLDDARVLLTEWLQWPGLAWALSPFTLPAAALRPPRRRPLGGRAQRPPDEWGDGAYHSLRLDALACLRFGPDKYFNVAILVDPGDISLDWFYHQFRSAYAWRRRREFDGHVRTFPIFVVIAANESRLWQLVRVCWNARWQQGGHPLYLRLTTREALRLPESERPWWNEHREAISGSWNVRIAFERPSLLPAGIESGWWGEMAKDEGEVIRLGTPLTLKRKPAGLLKWAARSTVPAARLVRDQQAVSMRALGLLNRVGQYPLITTGELAIILGQTYKNIGVGLKELQDHGLIDHPKADEDGYTLTHHGLALLAGQAGMTPTEYAQLRHWPVRREGRQVHYAVGALLACRAHTQLVLDFLVGLRRFGPRAHLKLRAWDHVQCIHEFPFESDWRRSKSSPARSRSDARRVIPDANGIVRAFGEKPTQFVDTTFWLEVDRHTEKGAALMNKLSRFYRYRLTQPWYRRDEDLPWLLIVVERNDEARLQALRRRLLALNQRWRTELNVRLSRTDLLDDGRGKLDPTKKAWRMVGSNEFISAFDMPNSRTSPPGHP